MLKSIHIVSETETFIYRKENGKAETKLILHVLYSTRLYIILVLYFLNTNLGFEHPNTQTSAHATEDKITKDII